MATNDYKTAVRLDADRLQVALDATYEIEQLADLIIRESKDEPTLVYRRLASRIRRLNGAIMSSLDDPNALTGDLASAVRGGW
jgi:hypothetical protein